MSVRQEDIEGDGDESGNIYRLQEMIKALMIKLGKAAIEE